MKSNKKIIGILGDIHNKGINIDKSKYKIIFLPAEHTNLFNKIFKSLDAIIVKTTKLYAKELSKCNKLKIISKHGVGIDNIDLNYLRDKNIKLTITKNANSVSVAEHAFLFMISLSRQLVISKRIIDDNNYKLKKKMIPNTYELLNKKIFIFGFGKIGKELAKRCNAFGMCVLFYDPKYKKKLFKNKTYKFVTFDYGVKNADFISIHAPLNVKTKNIFNINSFKKMKKNAFIINTSRGGIIDENDLLRAIKNNLILGAGIDVLNKEPPQKNYKLFNKDNILITPHSAASTEESRIRMAKESLDNITSFFENKNYFKKNLIINKK